MKKHVYINDVRKVAARLECEYSLKKLIKKENSGFKGYELIVYEKDAFINKNIIRDLSKLGLIFVSKTTNKKPYAEIYLFNF